MTHDKNIFKKKNAKELLDSDELAKKLSEELSKATSIDDFYGKDGIFSLVFSETIENMLEAELTEELSCEWYEAERRNSGTNRNGHYKRKMRTSAGDTEIRVPRDRNGEFCNGPQKLDLPQNLCLRGEFIRNLP